MQEAEEKITQWQTHYLNEGGRVNWSEARSWREGEV